MNDLERLTEIDNQIIKCNKCEVSKSLKLYPMPGFYTDISKVKLFIIGINPGQPQPNEDILLKELNNDYKKHYEIGIKKCKVGFFLDTVLKILNIGWNEIFFTNVIKCSTPENRMPTKKEMETCIDYLRFQKGLVEPKSILVLSKFAGEAIGLTGDLPFINESYGVKYYVIHHPSYLTRTNTTNKTIQFLKENFK